MVGLDGDRVADEADIVHFDLELLTHQTRLNGAQVRQHLVQADWRQSDSWTDETKAGGLFMTE